MRLQTLHFAFPIGSGLRHKGCVFSCNSLGSPSGRPQAELSVWKESLWTGRLPVRSGSAPGSNQGPTCQTVPWHRDWPGNQSTGFPLCFHWAPLPAPSGQTGSWVDCSLVSMAPGPQVSTAISWHWHCLGCMHMTPPTKPFL